jgi:GNAT superfamily N-acetyltransferase
VGSSGLSSATIEELSIPADLDAPGAGDFVRSVEIGNVIEAEIFGTPDIAYEPAEQLPDYRNPFQPRRLFVARVAGEIVARATTETTLGDDADTSWVTVQVLPAFRGRGIGSALAERVESAAAAEGKRKAIAYVGGTELGGRRLESPTGFGSVAADARETRFLLARGYSFEQVERFSRLPLPVDGLDEMLRDAEAASGADYRVDTWVGRIPERWLPDMAELITRMSTDAPTAGLEEPEDVWTVERLAAEEERIARDQPRRRFTAVAEHVPTGRVVAFSDISVPAQTHRAAMQYATLVRRDYRGHRLGMLVKIANLVHLERVEPGHPSILTFNAEENRHMLDVNETLGFTAIAYEGAWRKDLS